MNQKSLSLANNFSLVKLIDFLPIFIRYGVYLALFTPLLISSRFYFPFVGPKSLYFMAIVQIIFFAWLFLIVFRKEYWPKADKITIALIILLIILVLSSIFGVNPANSFWSKFERMTGLLMWFHLLAFFLVLSSVFKNKKDWEKIFNVSIFVATIISLFSLFNQAGVSFFHFSDNFGATLGNSSFLGTYLLFNIFLTIYLFLKEKENGKAKILLLATLSLMILSIFFESARAATISSIGGLGLLVILYLAFVSPQKWLRILGKIVLTISLVTIFIGTILIFQPGNFVNEKFREIISKDRLIVWQGAWQSFKEKPLFGWGPENFDIAFNKHFNPRLFIEGSIWFDRAHNVIYDFLVTTGLFGLLAYLGIFLSVFYTLWKKFSQKKIEPYLMIVSFSLLTAYFVQNLTVFDMVSSYLMFFLVLGFISSSTQEPIEREKNWAEIKINTPKKILVTVLIIIFVISFSKFIINPAITDHLTIKAFLVPHEKRVEIYQQALAVSSAGKYQIREFFADQSRSIATANFNKIPPEIMIRELDFVAGELKKTEEEIPIDFRPVLKLAQLYHVYSLFDPTKISLAEKYGEKAVEMSPNNQLTYWALARIKLNQGDKEEAITLYKKAVELEPRLGQAHWFLANAYKENKQLKEARQEAEIAKEIIARTNPAAIPQIEQFLRELGE